MRALSYMGKWCSQVGALWGPQWEYEVPTLSLEVFNAHMDGVLGAVVYASGQCWVNGLDWMVLGFFFKHNDSLVPSGLSLRRTGTPGTEICFVLRCHKTKRWRKEALS